MPVPGEIHLKIAPGVDVEASPLARSAGWSASSLIRFKNTWAESLRGFAQICNQALTGVCRALHFWVDLSRGQWFAAGTNSKLYIESGGTLYDITPTVGFTPGLVSTSGLGSLLIWSLDNFGQDLLACPSGQGIFEWTPPAVTTPAALITSTLTSALLVGGLIATSVPAILNGAFTININGSVVNVAGLNFSTITTVSQLAALLQGVIGPSVTVVGSLVGGGANWQLTLGTIATGNSATLSYATAPGSGTDVSAILGWTSGTAQSLREGSGSSPPPFNQGIFVAMPQQIVVAYGSSPTGGTQDPLLVRWCDQSDFTDWTVSTTNQAGSFRLSRGSKIVGGLQAPGVAILWTDIDVWLMQYEGFPLVFGFFQTSSNCGLIAEKAAVVLGTTVYWMADHGFFALSGSGATQIPCTVWDVVYRNIDQSNQDKCLAGADYHYSEVWWFYPSLNGNSGEIDSYVKYNIQDNLWDYGPASVGVPNQMSRTAWTDQNQPGYPISVDLNGIMEQADVGFTANGLAFNNGFIRSGYIDIADGGELMSVDQFIPDFLWDGTNPSLNLFIYFQNYSGDPPTVFGPFTITPADDYITLRQEIQITAGGVTVTAAPAIRARQVAVEIQTLSGWWRWGASRLRAAPAGSLP
jgi:hypothetical protein